MPPEQEAVSALQHVLALIEANDRRYAEQYTASQRAVELALAGQKDLVTAAFNANRDARAEAAALVAAQNGRIGELKERLDVLTSERAGVLGGWGYAVGAIGLALAAAAFLMKR